MNLQLDAVHTQIKQELSLMFLHQSLTEISTTSGYLETDDEGKKLGRKVGRAEGYEDKKRVNLTNTLKISFSAALQIFLKSVIFSLSF